ncbi:MAG: broad specificity phosphatase PhoE [Desulforhopalus sp.]|jgi:broad specificity phosphatase PhoE
MTNLPSQANSIFGLLRHGETEWNTKKRIQGFSNSPLTAKGISQTKEWAKTLQLWEWDHIYASDLGRVKQTTGILNQSLQLPTFFDKRLREQNWGDWEGLTIPALKRDYKEELKKRVALGWEFSAPGGETRSSVLERVCKALQSIRQNHPGKRTIIVCHQGVIKALLYHLSNRQFLPEEDPLIQHNNFHIISCTQNNFNIERLNISRQHATIGKNE